MECHEPAVGVGELEVKAIGVADVPTAARVPLMFNCWPELNLTETPGSMVSVTPELTVTLPVTTYGLPAVFQVVFAEIAPETLVSAKAGKVQQMTRTTAIAFKNRMMGAFLA